MTYTLTSFAVSTSTDGRLVARFGHDFPLIAIDATGKRRPRQAEGCCGTLAKVVADCEVVICTAIGQGAAGHLAEAGVKLAIVAEGTEVEDAIALYRTGRLQHGGTPSACDHAHDHAHQHGSGEGCARDAAHG